MSFKLGTSREEMVTQCSGLPLAIVTLGGILSTKSPTISEWEAVRNNLWKELKKDSIHINAVLTLKFQRLALLFETLLLVRGHVS